MPIGDKALKYRREDLIAKLVERIAAEEADHEEALMAHRRALAEWRKETAAYLRDQAKAVLSGQLDTASRGQMLERLKQSPNSPRPPQCRNSALERLKASTQDEVALNEAQYIALGGIALGARRMTGQ